MLPRWMAGLFAVPLWALACRSPPPEPAVRPAQYADPRWGTGGYAFGAGNASVGAAAPTGMVRVGPDTSGPYGTINFLHYSGYWAGDDTILAFSHLHLHGTGAQDYGVLGVLPVPAFDPNKFRVEDYASKFSKKSEIVSPGYYGVVLDNGPIHTEIAAATHSSHERFTFPRGSKSGTLIIDLDHHLTGSVIASKLTLSPESHAIRGQFQTRGGMSGGFPLYFEMRAKSAWTAQRLWSRSSTLATATSASGTGVGAALDFDTSSGAPVELLVGVSMVSAEGAAANLSAEIPNFDFERTRAAAEAAWDDRLGALVVHGGTEADRRTFYSAFHHIFVMPGNYGDIDGNYRYRGVTAHGSFHFLTDLSLWDTYRTTHPLYALAAGDVALDIMSSLDAMAKIGGFYPKWPLATSEAGTMIGASSDVVFADAFMRGVGAVDARAVYQRLRDAALSPVRPAGGRGGRDDDSSYETGYMALGYVPWTAERQRPAVSLTCELNQDDFALANFAETLGHLRGEPGLLEDARVLRERSHGWRKLYDPSTGLLRWRDKDGMIPPVGVDPGSFGDPECDEADGYQSEFCALFDVDGLAAVWGGRDKFVAALSDLKARSDEEWAADLAQAAMSKGSDPNLLKVNLPTKYFYARNQPDMHYPFLFALAGRPDLTQAWVPVLRKTFFSPNPDGEPENDDGGSWGAWYVWAALGLYPIAGSDLYVIGTPSFPKIDIRIGEGREAPFVIQADGVSPTNIYIESASLNGKRLDQPIVHHSDLISGGSLVLKMTSAPTQWGRDN